MTSPRTFRVRALRSAALLAFVALLAPPLPAGSPKTATGSGDDEAWRNTALGLFPDASRQFSAATKTTHARDSRLGLALTLLQLQPRTDARLREATGLLDALLDESTSDEVGAKARYFRARLEQMHRSPPDIPAAVRHYKTLREEHPHHPLAGQALVKLAILDIYGAPDDAARRSAFEDSTRQAATLPDDDISARRDLHLVLGEAALRLTLGERAALDHFLAASALGVESRALRADLLVRIGGLASAMNEPDLARQNYQRFLDEFPRDSRRRMIGEQLAGLAR